MKKELIQNIETALKNKNLDIIDLLTVVETYLQDEYDADDIQYVRLRDSMFSINVLMQSIEDEHTN
jgi:hypothetical protein